MMIILRYAGIGWKVVLVQWVFSELEGNTVVMSVI